MLPVALLCGGMAARMRPVTQSVPKAMLIVAGKPFIAHQLNLLKKHGVERVVLCVGYLGSIIEGFVGDGGRFDLDVSYSYDGEELLGTGGAVKKALSRLNDPFFVIYGDSYLDVDYAKVEEAYRGAAPVCEGLMTVFKNENKWDASNVVFKDNRIVTYSKKCYSKEMKYIDYGLGILSKKVFQRRCAHRKTQGCQISHEDPGRQVLQTPLGAREQQRHQASLGAREQQSHQAPLATWEQQSHQVTHGEREHRDFDYATVFDLADVYESLAKEGRLFGYEVYDRFYEIGSKKGLEEFEQMIIKKEGA